MTARVLYLSLNDGSDMRLNKEIRTMAASTGVDLVALGPDPAQCFAAPFVHELFFVKGNRKSRGTLLRYFARSAYLIVSRSYQSVHVVNEPQLIVLWLFLWLQKHVVLDIFDSIFLRKNRPGEQWLWFKKLVYAPVDRCIVTDENRRGLLPGFMQQKATVVPNYPHAMKALPDKEKLPGLTIMYFGWLGEHRGTETARGLLAADPTLSVVMAGWLADEPSRQLARHPRVEWLGVLPQAEANDIAARRADYLLCVYAPVNDNNINASPNKIYDAIQTQTPVIINREVAVAAFVERHRIGCVLPAYQVADYARLAADLAHRRGSYVFDDALRQTFTWENTEAALLEAHGLMTP